MFYPYVRDDEDDVDRMWHDHDPNDDSWIDRDEPEEPERELCPYCHGTTLDYLTDSHGTCPACFGGYVR